MTTRTNEKVQLGVFEKTDAADRAVGQLIRHGVAKERISVICPDCSGMDNDDVEQLSAAAQKREAPAILAGGAIGSVLGGLTAAAGVAATGGTALMVVGPLLGGAAAGGVTGGFIGAMAQRGVEPDAADFYDQALRKGRTLVAVEPPEGSGEPGQRRVLDVLSTHGARTYEKPS
jgi:hypothetical protein